MGEGVLARSHSPLEELESNNVRPGPGGFRRSTERDGVLLSIRWARAKAGRIRDLGRGAPAAVGRAGRLKAILSCRYHGLPRLGLGAPEGGPRHVGELIGARRLGRGRELERLVGLLQAMRPLDVGAPGASITCIDDLGQKIHLRFVYGVGPPETAVALPTGCPLVEVGKEKRQYAFSHGLLHDLEQLVPPKKRSRPGPRPTEDPQRSRTGGCSRS